MSSIEKEDCVREWIRNRPKLGAYYQLVQELRLSEPLLRVDLSTFELLLSEVGPPITCKDTVMLKVIPPAEGLAITLHVYYCIFK